ncbi:hypothetical protein KJ780_03540 [Candidatus Micrarchaeota archaeon]|nr:hypothetical protein [Candidatus Micrarchaeota archaeon]
MKYIVSKMKGAFYAGSDKVYSAGRKLRRYANLKAVSDMVKSLHLSVSSIAFKGLTKNEQKKVTGISKSAKKPAKKTTKTKKAKPKKRKKR